MGRIYEYLDRADEEGLEHPLLALLSGLSHPRLCNALVAMHDTPAQEWTLDELANAAGMSRSGAAIFENHRCRDWLWQRSRALSCVQGAIRAVSSAMEGQLLVVREA